MEIFEIVAAILAVFGGYTLFDMIRVRLLYPKRIRVRLVGAVIYDGKELSEVAAYARYLRLDQKISKQRLIILVKDDIINNMGDISAYGEIYNIIRCKENSEDAEHTDEREEP